MDPAYELLDAVKQGQIRALSDVVFLLGVDEAEALRLLRNAVSQAFIARDYTDLSGDPLAIRDRQIFRLNETGRVEWERLDGEARLQEPEPRRYASRLRHDDGPAGAASASQIFVAHLYAFVSRPAS